MMMRPHLAASRSHSFAGDRSGSSVVEFALLLPLMMTMYFGSIQITDAISADRQVTLVASTVDPARVFTVTSFARGPRLSTNT